MKKILLLSFFAFIASFLQAQTFTFECYCGDLSGAHCDICTGQTQTRFFCGLLVKKSGTVVKWIDAPYIVQWQGNNAVIKEIIPNPESIVINLSGTSFANLAAFKAALECPCNVPGKLFYISDSTKFARVIRGDTVTIVGNGGATVTLDTANQKFIVTAAAGAAQVLSATGAGPTQYNIALSGGGGAVVLKEGASINLTRLNDTITIANTSPDQTVTITGGGINVVTGTYPNYTITGTEIDGVTTNEGVLGVGAGGAASSVLLSNTSGASGVTINAAGINTISETTSSNGGQVTITGTEVDGSTTNELQNLSLTGQALGISSGTGVTLPVINVSAGTGISVSSSAGNYTVTNTGDLSNTNELQTISNTSDATSHTATLSNLGGSWKLVEGSNITLTTTGTTSDGIVTIAAASPGPGGIYGGSGSLPATGSTVTTNGQQLRFTTNTAAATEKVILDMSAPFSSDDSWTVWLRATTPADSFKIYSFDGKSGFYGSNVLLMKSDNYINLYADSIVGQTPSIGSSNKLPSLLGATIGGTFKQLVGTSNGQVLTWNAGSWAPAAPSSGGVTGTLTAGRVTLSAGASAVTDDADLLYDATANKMQIGTGTAQGFYNILQGSLSGTQNMYYARATVSGGMLSQQINESTGSTSNSGQVLQTGSGSAGDPYTQYKIGEGTTTVTVGLDNSDADKYKITPGASVPGGVANTGLTVTNDSPPRVGINRDAPTLELDINGRMRANLYSNAPSASFVANYSSGAGAASGSSISGGNNAFSWGFTTGTTTTANGTIVSITLPVSFFNAAVPVLFPANVNAANALANGLIYWDSASSAANTVVFKANGQLPPSTSYLFSVTLGGY